MSTSGVPRKASQGHPAPPINSKEGNRVMNLISTSWSCQRCGAALVDTNAIDGRTTVFCAWCQR